MKKHIARITILGLLATGILVTPVISRAQDANNDASSKQTVNPELKKAKALPFRGKVGAIDTEAKTFTVGKRTFQVTSETKLFKDNKPTKLSEISIGERVRGSYKKADNGRLDALNVHFGVKSGGKRKAPASGKE